MTDVHIFRSLWPAGRALALLGGVALLGACGGGAATTPQVTPIPAIPTPSTPTPVPTTPTPVPTPIPAGTMTGVQMRAGATTLITSYAGTTPPAYTALSTIPTTGSASYRGYLYGDLANTSDAITNSVIGKLTLNVGFDAASLKISGTADQFVDDADRVMGGALTLSGGALDRAGNPANDATLTVTADGTLTDADGRALDVGARLEGDFLGATYGAAGGEVLGGVMVNGVTQNFDGGFIAAR